MLYYVELKRGLKNQRMAEKEKPFNQAEYEKEYHREMYWRVPLYLSRKYDADIIQYLQQIKSRSGYLKRLIRNDMNRNDDSEEQSE